MRTLNPNEVTFTKHALSRLLEMAVEPVEITECLAKPESATESNAHEGQFNYRRGRLCLAVRVDAPGPRVVTALWATNEDWQADFDKAAYADRKRRTYFGSVA